MIEPEYILVAVVVEITQRQSNCLLMLKVFLGAKSTTEVVGCFSKFLSEVPHASNFNSQNVKTTPSSEPE